MSETSNALSLAELAADYVQYTRRHIFLTGKAGTGKTTFLRHIMALTHKKAIIVAPTGIAAINASGVTIHSQFQLPFGAFLPEEAYQSASLSGIAFNTPATLGRHFNQMRGARKQVLTELELLIIDEVSMLRADLLDAVDLVLRKVRRSEQHFGGVQLLFIGDLHQLPPVSKAEEWSVMRHFYKSLYFFDALALRHDPPVYIELDKIYRQSDAVFIELLNNLRNNQVTQQDVDLLGKYYKPGFKPDASEKYITLTTHNTQAQTLNENSLAALPGKSFFFAANVEDDFPETAYPVERRLELKKGAQIMFVKNDPTGERRFFNGKIGTVCSISNDHIEVELSDSKDRIFLEPYRWENIRYTPRKSSNEIEEEVLGSFTQYPVRLAWAVTVHKSQGLTFDKAIIDVGKAFAPGQVYVALSRLRSLDGLVLTSLIGTRGISLDQHVFEFGRAGKTRENPSVQIKTDTAGFMREYLLAAYDFGQSAWQITEHRQSYTKDESRSAKQTHESWAASVLEAFLVLKNHADGFVRQLNKLFAAQAPMAHVRERVEAATSFFVPKLEALGENVLSHIATVKIQKHIKTYLAELLDLELVLFEQQKRVRKAGALLLAVSTGASFTRENVAQLINLQVREEKLKAATASPLPASPEEKSAAKEAKPKTVRGDSRRISLQLFKEGKTLEQIAANRNMTVGTIEGHLAFFVAKNELGAAEIIPQKKLNEIVAAIKELDTLQMKPVKDHLGKDYSYNEIRIALAYHLAAKE